MAISEFSFTPTDGFLNTSSYPDPATETETRTQLMSLHNQTKAYLNGVVVTAIHALEAASGDPEALAEIVNSLTNVQTTQAQQAARMTSIENSFGSMQSDITSLKARPVVSAYTMTAGGWSGTTYSFEGTYPSTDYDIEIELNADSATATEIEAWSEAQILGSATTNVVTAFGDVPIVALPIIMKVTAKL